MTHDKASNYKKYDDDEPFDVSCFVIFCQLIGSCCILF